jgi:virginiamycin B lyase
MHYSTSEVIPMRRTCKAIVFVLSGAVLLPAGLGAQLPKVAKQAPGSLGGTVVNAKGAPVAGAQIVWQAADASKPHALHSDAQGHFHIAHLRTGIYDLSASTGDAASDWSRNVLVRPGAETNVTLRLESTAPPAQAVLELKGTMRTWDVPVPGALPHDPAVDPQGNVWFTLQQAGQLARFSPDTQEWKLFKVPTPDSGPHGLVSDTKGYIWFTENYAGKIGRLDPKSSLVTEYSAPTAKDPHTPVFGPDGGLWFTAQDSNLIGRVDMTTGKISEFGVPTQGAHPYGIVSADDGALWFCELTGGKLGRVDPKTGVIAEFAPPNSDMHPRRLVAVKGAIYFTDFGGGRLGRLTLTDKKFQLWDSPSGNGSEPYGIAVDSTGKIWYEESATKANKLVRVDPATLKFTVYPMPAKNSSVRNITRDARGRLWMPLSLPNKIMMVE